MDNEQQTDNNSDTESSWWVFTGVVFFVTIGVLEWFRVDWGESISDIVYYIVLGSVILFALAGYFINWLSYVMKNSVNFKEDFPSATSSFVEYAMEEDGESKVQATRNAVLVVSIIVYLAMMTPLIKNGEFIVAMIMMYGMMLFSSGVNRAINAMYAEVKRVRLEIIRQKKKEIIALQEETEELRKEEREFRESQEFAEDVQKQLDINERVADLERRTAELIGEDDDVK